MGSHSDNDPPFDSSLDDSQATALERLPVGEFDLDAYAAYDAELMPRAKAFWEADSGVAVYRRFRARPVFSTASNSPQASLEYQLDGLKKSMEFKMDIPNFIEPWYGIGTIAAAFGNADFIWKEDQAPVLAKSFQSVEEALACEPVAVKDTTVGQATIDMIHYFLEQTEGKIPMSFTDTQSPMSNACALMQMVTFFMAMVDNPEGVSELLGRIAEKHIEFNDLQRDLIGEALVNPGHGFPSSRHFEGLGFSDDNFIMVSDNAYESLPQPAFEKVGKAIGGAGLHSCGDWSNKLDLAMEIDGIRYLDAAFSAQTDPMYNPPEPFGEAMAGTGVILVMRAVGKPDVVVDKVRRVWRPGLRLLAVTYCETPEEQEEAYDRIHEICT
jgi:hypothetical protein